MDALAVQYARELSRWGIETSIIVPGAFTKGTNHFAHSGRPADEARLAEYEAGPYQGFGEQVQEAFAAIVPEDADVAGVADAIVEVVDTPFGKRPFRVHYDPTEDGANVGFTVLDRLRAEMLHRVGLSDLLKPAKLVSKLLINQVSARRRQWRRAQISPLHDRRAYARRITRLRVPELPCPCGFADRHLCPAAECVPSRTAPWR